jgi:hypothetical protein
MSPEATISRQGFVWGEQVVSGQHVCK